MTFSSFASLSSGGNDGLRSFMECCREKGIDFLLDYMKTPGMMGKNYLSAPEFDDSRSRLFELYILFLVTFEIEAL